jgi:hypothetical protein
MAREDPQLKLRLPADLKEKIEAAATAGSRTINAEVVARLQRSFDSTAFHHIEREALINQAVALESQALMLQHQLETRWAELKAQPKSGARREEIEAQVALLQGKITELDDRARTLRDRATSSTSPSAPPFPA